MTLRRNAKYFIGALCISVIIIGMVCGFMLVDLSSDRYMPGLLAPIYLIGSIGPDGVHFYLLGQAYRLEIEQVKQAQRALWDFRGLLPRTVRLAGGLAVQMSNLR